MLLKIIAIGAVSIVSAAIIKTYRPDIALVVSICGGVAIVLLSISEIENILSGISSIGAQASAVIRPMIKVLCVAYLTEFCADMAEDAGNKTIQSKILLGGKISICAIAIPIVSQMLSTILSLL
ncbi:MAG: hypothetical protein IJ542_03255 [Clostridia bacterium]|nr:hypothetical protein [Clostridia bacterium]